MNQIEVATLVMNALPGHDNLAVSSCIDFKPTKLVLKSEDEDEDTGAPVGPLFYRSENFSESTPVVYDTTVPGITRPFSAAWLSYSEAKVIAKQLNLPLEVE